MNSKKHLGHTARKRFGQNFLHDNNVIQNIVATIYPQTNQFLVEIGPGLGALTEPVAEQVEHLTVLELDRDLAERLRHHPFLHQKLNVIETDAMQFDFSSLYKQEHLAEKGQKLRVFGNLPYNISTPLMFHSRHAFHVAKRSGETPMCRTKQQGLRKIDYHGAIFLPSHAGVGSATKCLQTCAKSGFCGGSLNPACHTAASGQGFILA